MSVVTLMSATGSPGVTSTALGLGVAWHRPALFVDADPSAASAPLAGFLRGAAAPASVVQLVADAGSPLLGAAVADAMLPLPGTNLALLAGMQSPIQRQAVSGLWEPLLRVLRDLERSNQDVFVDAGRYGMNLPAQALIRGADFLVMVCGSSLPNVVGARAAVSGLNHELGGTAVQERVRLLVVGEGRPYGAKEIAQQLGIGLLGSIRWDPQRARVLSEGEPMSKRFLRSPLGSSYRAAAEALRRELMQGDTSPAVMADEQWGQSA